MYYARNDITDVIRDALLTIKDANGKPLFNPKGVSRAALSNMDHLMQVLDTPNVTPGAVIVMSKGISADRDIFRYLNIMIVCFTEFRATSVQESADIGMLLDAVEGLFHPVLGADHRPQHFMLTDGSVIRWVDSDVMASQPRLAACYVLLQLTEPAKQQITETPKKKENSNG